MRYLFFLSLFMLSGCIDVPGKEDVSLPPESRSFLPQQVAHIDDGVDVLDLKTVGDTLFVAHDKGISIYDVSDPSMPQKLSRLDYDRADSIATDGQVLYSIAINGSHTLTTVNVSDPASPVVANTREAVSQIFGGLALQDNLLWQAVGSSPPSRLYRTDAALETCPIGDGERGVMDVWLSSPYGFSTVHFDDFAGDKLDGNGGFGLVVYTIHSQANAPCPLFEVEDIFFFDSHSKNRSAFERPGNSDLQVHYVSQSRSAFVTGEQALRRFLLSPGGTLILLDEVPIPDILGVAALHHPEGMVIGVTNQDFHLVDASQPSLLEYSAKLTTDGVSRTVVSATTNRHFFVGNGSEGVSVVEVRRGP